MAKSVLNKKITDSTPYTIPAGKYAMFTAFPIKQTGSPQKFIPVVIGGVQVAAIGAEALASTDGVIYSDANPLQAAAGDAISTTSGSEYGISGWLFDA